MAERKAALTCEEDEAEHEPHVPPWRFKHGGEGSAQDAAEYVGAVSEFVLCRDRVISGTASGSLRSQYYR